MEVIMSDGGIGNGVSFWASIKISGDLKKEELQEVMQKIKGILNGAAGGKPVNGRLVSAARLSDKGGEPKLTVTYDKNVK
jgi:hypothetical protein